MTSSGKLRVCVKQGNAFGVELDPAKTFGTAARTQCMLSSLTPGAAICCGREVLH